MEANRGQGRLRVVWSHLQPTETIGARLNAQQTGFLPRSLGDMQTTIPIGDVVMSERHGGELVAETLARHGVKFLFTLTGGHISPILVACKHKSIRVIDVRHEASAVFAADAVARLSGVPGVAAVTAGPGITNTVTAIKNAQMAQSPLLLIGGAAATMTKGRGALQDIDQMVLLKPIVKFAATVTRVRDIVPTLRKAFQIAMSGTPGPVFVEFPLDVLYPINELRSGMGMCERMRVRQITDKNMDALILPAEFAAKGMSKKDYLASKQPDAPVFLETNKASSTPLHVSLYMKYKIASLFAGAWDVTEKDMEPLPISVPQPTASQISKTVEHLLKAKHPVMIISSQAMLGGPEKARELQQAVMAMGIPTFLGGMGRGLLGKQCQYHIRQNRGMALKKADVVILAGTVCDFRMDYGRTLNKSSTVISVNRSPTDMVLNAGVFWNPSMTCNCDPCAFVLAVAQEYGKRRAAQAAKSKKPAPTPAFDVWASELKQADKKKEDQNRAKASEPAFGRLSKAGQPLLNPLELFHKLDDILPDNAILVADGGDFVATASYVLRARGPLGWLDPGAFGTLGVGGGFALGAKLCRPDAEVWLIWGDGSSGYSLAEFDTFRRHGVPVIGLIGNDACWTQIEREQIPVFSDDVACPLEYCHYDEVSQGYGGRGLVINTAKDDVVGVLRNAQHVVNNVHMPVVVNAIIGRTNFREGSLSV